MTGPVSPEDRDRRLRAAAREWLERRSLGGTVAIHGNDLRRDFEFDGARVPLITQGGIWKPASLSAALTIRTTYTPSGRPRPYEDAPGPDGLPRYKWRGADPLQADNRALRAAMQRQLPLIWLHGTEPAHYLPIVDIYVVHEEPDRQQFVLNPGSVLALPTDSPVEEWLRRYLLAQTHQRLHQPVFRANVIRAYEKRCAICALNHPELLDAAHIVPDSDESGIAAVRNGIALCKIHHAAFDRGFLGIRPDLVVQIRADLLKESDGPMLLHGLQGRHGQPLMSLPRSRMERPDLDLLHRTFARFQAGRGAA